jgi:hypothetical protein
MVDDSSSRYKPVCNALFKLVKMSRVSRSEIFYKYININFINIVDMYVLCSSNDYLFY